MSRVKQTLEGFEGVERVQFWPAKEQFEVEYRAEVPLGEDFKKSVTDVIIFPAVRKFLGCIGDKLNNSPDRGL